MKSALYSHYRLVHRSQQALKPHVTATVTAAALLSSRHYPTLQTQRYFNDLSLRASFIRQHSDNRNLSKKLLLSPTEATRTLRTHEATVDVGITCPIKYYDVNYLGSNTPPEDRSAQAKLIGSDIFMFGVFDGHGGHYCSDTINMRLFDYIGVNLLQTQQLEDKVNSQETDDPLKVAYQLWSTYQSPYPDMRSHKLREIHKRSLNEYAYELLKDRHMEESMGNEVKLDVHKSLEDAFVKLDADILAEAVPKDPLQPDRELMDVAMSGSCACVAVLSGRNLYVANAGDARAIIGQEEDDGSYSPYFMSSEHNAENAAEMQRLYSEHPKLEHPNLVRDGRLLEMLLPFRAFGDVRFKWTPKELKTYTVPVYGHGHVPSNYYSPPYVTAKPEIKHRQLNYKDKFLVLATDGLFDLLSPERVVQLISNHMRGQQSFDLYSLPEDRTIKLQQVFEDLTKRRVSIFHQPVDHNSATHLIRHALGNDHFQLSNYLLADSPRSIRDDITINVVYFDTDHIIETYT